MTVNTTNITSGPYIGNGLSDTYSYLFRVEDKTQLSVYETTDAGAQTLLVVDTDYTVLGIGVDGGGTIVRLAGNLPTDYTWYIRSNYVENQLTAFASQGGFFPDVHEKQMDHITFLIQQLRDEITRTFRLSDSIDIDGDFNLLNDAADRSSQYLAFGPSGDLVISSGTGADAGLRADLASLLLGQGASLLAVRDAAGKFAGEDVETVLAEIDDNAISVQNANGVLYSNIHSNMSVRKWTTESSAADNDWYSVCWSPELTLFVAVAGTGIGNRVMTSPDGINWTVQTPAADNQWLSVCWSPELTLFVAVASSGTGNRVMTSPDGINWTIRVSAADNNWRSVCWSPELTLFVAVATTGTGDRVMTSPDGINWTIRVSAADNQWLSVCWSPELTLFVAVAITGTGNRVMTSPDGINWTIRVSAADNSWHSVCWSPELTLFVAVATTGTGDGVMTSPDGINWTIRVSAADNSWLSVCWSPELTLFVAVASSGTGNRVMTSL